MSDGVRVEFRDVTPQCRHNHGDYKAYDDASHQLLHAYETLLTRHPGDTFRLSLERVPDDGRETT